jgi:hypothetical protein
MTSSGTVYVFGKDIYEAYDLGWNARHFTFLLNVFVINNNE